VSEDFSFNALNASDYYFEMGRFFDALLPSQNQYVIDIPKIAGFTQLSKSIDAREIPVTGVLYAPDRATLLTRIEAFKAFLYYDVDKPLIFSDTPHKYYNAQYLERYKLEKKADFAPIELKFTCNDPFGYAITADSVTKSNIVTNGYTFTITNAGQTYAWPIITITFHQNQSHIYMLNNNINDDRFDMTKAFVTNDVLIIDSKTERITLNNVYSPAGMGDGGSLANEFILLRGGVGGLGDNLLQIGTTDATLNVSVNIWFRKTYL
jgi:predicted phage tail component-like protein